MFGKCTNTQWRGKTSLTLNMLTMGKNGIVTYCGNVFRVIIPGLLHRLKTLCTTQFALTKSLQELDRAHCLWLKLREKASQCILSKLLGLYIWNKYSKKHLITDIYMYSHGIKGWLKWKRSQKIEWCIYCIDFLFFVNFLIHRTQTYAETPSRRKQMKQAHTHARIPSLSVTNTLTLCIDSQCIRN